MSSKPDLKALQAQLLAAREKLEDELGLGVPAPVSSTLRRQISARSSNARSGSRSDRAVAEPADVRLPLTRRSAREAELGATGAGAAKRSRGEASSSRAADESSSDSSDEEVAVRRRPAGWSAAPSAGTPGSLKTLTADPGRMHALYLGRPVPLTAGGNEAKRSVILEANGSPGFTPKIAAMGGVKEWKNCIMLFCNLGPDSGNEFLDGGRRVTWFAPDSQTVYSPQVQRLIHHATGVQYPPPSADGGELAGSSNGKSAGKGGKGSGSSRGTILEPCEVCLACRVAGTVRYVWLGALQYESHDPASAPLKFVWRLAHFDNLIAGTAPEAAASSAAAGGAGAGAGAAPGRRRAAADDDDDDAVPPTPFQALLTAAAKGKK